MEARDEKRRRRRLGLLAIFSLAAAWALLIQPLGWAQTSNYALVRSLADGTSRIDAHHWETRDKSYFKGHFYSVKAPGLAFLTLPFYEVLKALDAQSASDWAARSARRNAAGRWSPGGRPHGLYGDDLARALRVRATIERETGIVWALGLLGSVLPALLLLLLVRAIADRIEPGFGTAAAVTLGLGTLVMPFATLFFSHVLSALLAFAAFALLWLEREGRPRLKLVALAGLISGLAVTIEYPLAIAAAIIGAYALARGDTVRRGLTYAGGVCAGLLPLAIYNLWAFGSITHLSYNDAVAVQGKTGHAALGLNDGGFFGIDLPSVGVALKLLFSSRGLLTLSPVLALALVGVVLLYRRGRRAEALAIGGMALAYLVYNSGYYLPFGGGSPGTRFLIPILPFLAVPLTIAYRRFPAATLGLAVASALMMLAATTTQPLLGNDSIGYWAHVVELASFEHTIATLLGAGNGWGGLAPFVVAVAAAAVLAALATRRPSLKGGVVPAVGAVLSWACVASVAPRIVGQDTGGTWNNEALALILVVAASSLAVVMAAALLERRPWTILSLQLNGRRRGDEAPSQRGAM